MENSALLALSAKCAVIWEYTSAAARWLRRLTGAKAAKKKGIEIFSMVKTVSDWYNEDETASWGSDVLKM